MKQPDLKTAIRLYYEKSELTSKDIMELFSVSMSCAGNMKRRVRKVMTERNVSTYYPRTINTKVAYDVWGINIEECEKHYAKLIKLGFKPQEREEN